MTNAFFRVISPQALRGKHFLTVGAYNIEVPPVPFPNTVVKLNCAKNNWREAARGNR